MVAAGACWFGPARAQVQPPGMPRVRMQRIFPTRLDLLPPPEGLRADQQAVIRWENHDDLNQLDRDWIPSATWYYCAQPDGSDRHRMVTSFHDRFENGFGDNWIPVNDVRQDWDLFQETRRGPRLLRSRANGDPLVSLDHWEKNFVFSARLRPLPGAQRFGIAVRANRDSGAAYVLRGTAELLNPQDPQDPALVRHKAVGVVADRWFWYELGVRNRKVEVELRGRIWDGNHERVLDGGLYGRDCLTKTNCPQGQRVALLPGADYSEVYVDPWEARWISAPQGEFEWDTRNVPEGDYYVLAVVDAQRQAQACQRLSEFKISVRH
jgi:hypothetical protein